MSIFKDAKAGDDLVVIALIENLQKRFTQANASYYSATLNDGETSVDARIWDCSIIESIKASAGEVYEFNAHANSYGNKLQYIITQVKKPLEGSYDPKTFFKGAPLSKEELMNELREYIKKIENEVMKKILHHVFSKYSIPFFDYPAAISMHHNYQQGLAYHTYSMLRLADRLLELYPGMNQDLLYTGILLHDIGKIKELSNAVAPVYTSDGNLLGHIVMGIEIVNEAAIATDSKDSEEVRCLQHLIASHHGELEFGSPKEPMMMEAYALHLVDLLDSRMASISPEVVKTKAGEQTTPISSLGRKNLYKANLK